MPRSKCEHKSTRTTAHAIFWVCHIWVCHIWQEDFAVLRFVEHTATASYDAIRCPSHVPSEEYFLNQKRELRESTSRPYGPPSRKSILRNSEGSLLGV
jgi:hypothetical protein